MKPAEIIALSKVVKAAEAKAARKAQAAEDARLDAAYRTSRVDDDGVAILPQNSEEAVA